MNNVQNSNNSSEVVCILAIDLIVRNVCKFLPINDMLTLRTCSKSINREVDWFINFKRMLTVVFNPHTWTIYQTASNNTYRINTVYFNNIMFRWYDSVFLRYAMRDTNKIYFSNCLSHISFDDVVNHAILQKYHMKTAQLFLTDAVRNLIPLRNYPRLNKFYLHTYDDVNDDFFASKILQLFRSSPLLQDISIDLKVYMNLYPAMRMNNISIRLIRILWHEHTLIERHVRQAIRERVCDFKIIIVDQNVYSANMEFFNRFENSNSIRVRVCNRND